MATTVTIIDFLRSVAKMQTDVIDERCIKQFVQENKMKSYDHLLKQHKIKYLFLKKIIDFGLTEYVDFGLCYHHSCELVFLQQKYKEYLSTIKKLTEELDRNQISYSILKGFSFIHDLYTESNTIYRNFADVDILISDENTGTVSKILNNLGFVQGYLDGSLLKPASRQELIYWRLNSHQLHEFVKFSSYAHISPFLLTHIDINFTIFEGGKYSIPISTSEILKHCDRRRIADELYPCCLDYTYGLIQLCYHFYKDTVYDIKKETASDYVLIKFCDIREYILNYRDLICWEEFIDVVTQANIFKEIGFVLNMVSSFYGDLRIDNVLEMLHIDEVNFNWERLIGIIKEENQ